MFSGYFGPLRLYVTQSPAIFEIDGKEEGCVSCNARDVTTPLQEAWPLWVKTQEQTMSRRQRDAILFPAQTHRRKKQNGRKEKTI